MAAANVGLAPLWDAEAATVIRRWGNAAMAGGVVVLLCNAIARQLEESWPAVSARFLSIMNRLSSAVAGRSRLTWLIGWTAFHMSGDPEWVSSGIDWHDSHLMRTPSSTETTALLRVATALPLRRRLFLLDRVGPRHHDTAGGRIAAIATAVPLYIVGRTLSRSAASPTYSSSPAWRPSACTRTR